jgi:hypothetical protein
MSEIRQEGGIQTFSGHIVSPLWPNEDTIVIEDVAHGLGFMCRFAGQCKVFYSVAQHCVIMSRWFRKRGLYKEARYALMHEAAEGMGMMDMPHPIKYLKVMRPYKLLESTYQSSLYRKFGLFDEPPPVVKELDVRICAAEAKVLMNPVPSYALAVDTSDLVIKPYNNISDGKKYFLKEYKLLFDK